MPAISNRNALAVFVIGCYLPMPAPHTRTLTIVFSTSVIKKTSILHIYQSIYLIIFGYNERAKLMVVSNSSC